MKDKITVNVACYSKSNPKYLKETVDSIVVQGVEVCVIPDERNTAIKWDEAIDTCKTPYLHLAHHDDVYLPGFYEETIAWLDAHPEASAVFTLDYIINEHGRRVGQTNLPFPPKDSYDYTFVFNQMARHGNFIRCPSFVVRVDKMRGIPHPIDECKTANDTAYWYLCMLQGPIGIIPKKLYQYRQYPDSDTSKTMNEQKENHLRAMRFALRHHPNKTDIDWDMLIVLSREFKGLEELDNARRIQAHADGAGNTSFLVAHEPPDNAGTGVLVAARVRDRNSVGDDRCCYYVYPVSGTDQVTVGVERGLPVIRCPSFGFWQVVEKLKPNEIEYHHLIGWPLGILEKREGIRQTLYLHDSWLWCAKAHFINERQTLCDGPGPSRCQTCAEFSPADYAARSETLAKLLPQLDGIYANSQYTLEMARQYLPQGLNIGLHEFEVPGLPLYARRKRIGYFGYWNPVKGIHVLMQAFQKVTGAQLLLFCEVPKEYRDGRTIYGFDNVLVMGSYRRSDLPLLGNLVDIGVVPSLNESFGLVGRELEMLGVPCIKTGTGGQTGSVVPGDVESLAKALQEAVDA